MEQFEQKLADYLAGFPTSRIQKAMEYSLLAKGKRVRPRLLFAVLAGYGIPAEVGYPMAAAIEMVHTYSLIHDDLPAMDDDDLRRGVLTCHKKFDEATAILAGDALLTHAFYLAAMASDDATINVQLVKLLSEYSGAYGMILGQCFDLQAESDPDLTIDQLKKIHRLKTGKLFTLPLLSACLLAKNEKDQAAWEIFGEQLGLAFQIQDDLLDVSVSEELLGKSTSDAKNEKTTIVSLLKVEEAQKMIEECFENCNQQIKSLDFDATQLHMILEQLTHRKK